MRKLFLGIWTMIFLTAVAGCSTSYTYFEAEARSEYYPFAVENVTQDKAATIKTANGISIFKVDQSRIANMFEVMAGKHDSILVEEGSHSLTCTRRSNGRDVRIGKSFYQANHEYLIDYIEENNGSRITMYYWVKDLTDNKVISGKEVTRESLIKEKQPE